MGYENTHYLFVNTKSLIAKYLQIIPWWAFCFLIGWLVGILVYRFAARVALWTGIIVLILMLLIVLGLIDINNLNIASLFSTLSDWLVQVGNNLRNNVFVRLDGPAVIFLILGIALSVHQSKRSTQRSTISTTSIIDDEL